jgi:hypothetical protein
MNAMCQLIEPSRYARCIAASKKVRWEIEADVIRGRRFGAGEKLLPDDLSLIGEFAGLSADEQRFVSRIQGRTYANVFGLVERYIAAKVLEISRDYWLGDQVALEALVRFGDEELKHQQLFRRIEALAAQAMPAGYRFVADPDAVAGAVLSKSDWAVLALTLDIELFTQVHYRRSIDPDAELSPLFRDVFLFHWEEESQHAILDELEWRRHDARLSQDERDRAVDDFIDLVGAVDAILQAQATADARYFASACGRAVSAAGQAAIEAAFLKAYRWQYIHSGAGHPHFGKVLCSLVSSAQLERIGEALSTLN